MGRWRSVEAAVLDELLCLLEEREDTVGLDALMSYLVDGVSVPAYRPPGQLWDIATVGPEAPPTVL